MLNRAWLAGGIPRTACVAAYEPICAVSLADSYINRANPGTYNAAPGVAPTWSESRGWIAGGAAYLRTGIIPTSTWTLMCRFSGASGTGYLAGVFQDNTNQAGLAFSPNRSGSAVRYRNNGQADVSPTMTGGVLALASVYCYRDGVLVDSSMPGGGVAITSDISIMSLNYIGLSDAGYAPITADVQAVYIYNVPLTPTQVKAVTDAMNSLPMRPSKFQRQLGGQDSKRFPRSINKSPFIRS